MVLKQKQGKAVRQRGNSSHGWGHKKKHRGSGHRGGFGLAGTGARGDSQKAGMLSQSKGFLKKYSATRGVKIDDIKKSLRSKAYFGKKGFTSIHKKSNKVLSLSYIENNFDKLVEQGLIVKEKSEFVFDTTVQKYDKILGKGKFSKKVTLICNNISESAKTRVEEVGGKVTIVNASEESEE